MVAEHVGDRWPSAVSAMLLDPAMLRLTRELLERECGCWVATEIHTAGSQLRPSRGYVDVRSLVFDAADFAACCVAAAGMRVRTRPAVADD